MRKNGFLSICNCKKKKKKKKHHLKWIFESRKCSKWLVILSNINFEHIFSYFQFLPDKHVKYKKLQFFHIIKNMLDMCVVRYKLHIEQLAVSFMRCLTLNRLFIHFDKLFIRFRDYGESWNAFDVAFSSLYEPLNV